MVSLTKDRSKKYLFVIVSGGHFWQDLISNTAWGLFETGCKKPFVIVHTPMAEFGRPEDLIGTCIWLASDASGFVTGTVIPIDGGFGAYSGV